MLDSAARIRSRRQPSFGAINVPDLFVALHDLLTQIPRGRVTTYGDLAEALGAVGAARWIAAYLGDPAGPRHLPRHRVVLRDGSLGKSGVDTIAEKRSRLTSEGISVKRGVIDLATYRFRQFESTQPLLALQQLQEQIVRQLKLVAPARLPRFVAGVDVSYAGKSNAGPIEAFATYALVEVASKQVVWSLTMSDTVAFPYIPGFLAFRELPIYLKLMARVVEAGRLADVLLVDGNGILHQRHAGIATHLGVLVRMPTIGIGKSLLCGTIEGTPLGKEAVRQVVLRGETVACAISSAPRFKPVFVSPGNLVDLPFAAALVQRLFAGHHVPEPIYHAHTLSRAAARNALSTER